MAVCLWTKSNVSNLSNIQYNAEGGFCEEGETGGQLVIPGDSGRTVRFSSFVCLSRLMGPLWRLDRLIPPPASSHPPCLVCMSAFSFSLGGISLSPLPPPKNRCLECYTDQGKIISCPFVLAADSTGENKLMVMKPYRVRFRQRLWCDLPSSRMELSSRGPPTVSWGPQPADRTPAHSNAKVFLLQPFPPNPTQLLQHLLISYTCGPVKNNYVNHTHLFHRQSYIHIWIFYIPIPSDTLLSPPDFFANQQEQSTVPRISWHTVEMLVIRTKKKY